jgi:hypothetical protein
MQIPMPFLAFLNEPVREISGVEDSAGNFYQFSKPNWLEILPHLLVQCLPKWMQAATFQIGPVVALLE